VAFVSVILSQQAQNLTQSEATKFVNTAKSAAAPHLQVAVAGQLAELSDPQSIGGTGPG